MPTNFVVPPHNPYPWHDAPTTSTPLDAAHLEAAAQDVISYAQQGDLAVVNYFENGSSVLVPTGPTFGTTFVRAPSGDVSGATDTTNINSARDTAGINSTLQFRAGTYWVKGLTASVANQLWRLPMGCIIIVAAAQNTPVITINANGVRIEGPGAIDGNSANNTGGSTLGIWFSTPLTNCAVRWLTIQNCYAGGIVLYTGGTTIQSCRVTNIVNGAAIYGQPSSTADVIDTHILDNRIDKTTSTGGYGIQIHGGPGATNYYQRRLIIRGNLIGLPSSPGTTRIGIEAWGGCPGVAITGNKVFGGTMGISADRCDIATIDDNEVYGPTANGIEVAGCIGATVNANTIDGNGLLGGGIILDGLTPGGSSKCSVTGNTIRNLNTGGNAKYLYGIGGDHNIWGDNTIYVTATAGASGLYCQNSSHNGISNNNLFGNSVASYAITFDGATSNGTILGNLFDGWTANNVVLYEGSTVTTSALLSTGAPITSIPVNALGITIPAGTVWIGSPANLQSQAWTTTGAGSGATSIPVTSQTPNYAYPSGSNITLTTPVLDTISVGINKHITGNATGRVGAAIPGPNCPVTPIAPMSQPAYAATITPDSHQAKTWRPGVLTGNITINAPTTTSTHQGQELWIVLQQDATGGRTITWNAVFVNTPTTNTAANAYTTARFVHDGINWVSV